MFHVTFYHSICKELLYAIPDPKIYEISNTGSDFLLDMESSSENVTALSTGGSKIMIVGYGFSRVSAISNKVFIDENIECEIVNYYTTPTQIQCVVPPCTEDKLRVPLSIKVVVDGVKNSTFVGKEIKLVYICN